MAARRHWRFVVRDQYGFVIANAQVFVYQPGTTTAFTGTAYDAASGGSPVTNPFTSNAFGEVEAWFDTAQVVDVKVTDNSNLAYRAVGGVSDTQDFPDFIEADDIYVSASDQVSADFGEAGDIAATLVNPFTAVTGAAGATGEYADAGHVHPYTALTPAVPLRNRSVAWEGAVNKPAREDHTHPLEPTLARATQFTPVADLNDQSFFSYSIPANSLVAGSSFMFRGVLYWTNAATVSGLILKVRLNSISGNVVALGPTLTSTATTHTDTPVTFEGLITVRTIGGSGTIIGDLAGIETITVAAGTKTPYAAAISAAVAIDTTVPNTFEIIGDIQTSNTGIQYKVDTVAVWQVA